VKPLTTKLFYPRLYRRLKSHHPINSPKTQDCHTECAKKCVVFHFPTSNHSAAGHRAGRSNPIKQEKIWAILPHLSVNCKVCDDCPCAELSGRRHWRKRLHLHSLDLSSWEVKVIKVPAFTLEFLLLLVIVTQCAKLFYCIVFFAYISCVNIILLIRIFLALAHIFTAYSESLKPQPQLEFHSAHWP
jgi:hypothetical protein